MLTGRLNVALVAFFLCYMRMGDGDVFISSVFILRIIGRNNSSLKFLKGGKCGGTMRAS